VSADGLLWYGTGLSICGVFANALLLILLLIGLIRGRINQADVGHRWLLVNHVGVQILVSCLVIPLMLAVDRLEGGWRWGGPACRAWIVARLWIAGANFWSLLSLVFDRFLCVAAWSAYVRWMIGEQSGVRGGRYCRGLLVVVVVIVATWLISSLAVVPTITAVVDRPNFLLEQVYSYATVVLYAMYIFCLINQTACNFLNKRVGFEMSAGQKTQKSPVRFSPTDCVRNGKPGY